MANQQPDDYYSLAQIWRCNGVQFKVLLLVEAKKGQIEYDDKDYHVLTGQPGQTLRAMVARGWLDGPTRKQKPRAKPWILSDEGRALLRKIRMGLRPPDKLTSHQHQALIRYGEGQPLQGLPPATITSLQNWGYLSNGSAGEQRGTLTPLGQEAYEDLMAYLQKAKEKGRTIAGNAKSEVLKVLNEVMTWANQHGFDRNRLLNLQARLENRPLQFTLL